MLGILHWEVRLTPVFFLPVYWQNCLKKKKRLSDETSCLSYSLLFCSILYILE